MLQAEFPSLDILTLLKNQHAVLREYIGALKSDGVHAIEKQSKLRNFISLIKTYADAKTLSIYEVLKDSQEAQLLIYESMEDQAVTKILISELEELNYQTNWDSNISQKAKILAIIVEHSLDDEEVEFFFAARNLLTEAELIVVGDHFTEEFLK